MPPEDLCKKCFSAYEVSLFALKAARMMLKTTVGPAMSDKATAGLGSKGVSISRLPYLTATEPAGLRAVQIVCVPFPLCTHRLMLRLLKLLLSKLLLQHSQAPDEGIASESHQRRRRISI